MTALSPGQSPPPVSIPIRIAASPSALLYPAASPCPGREIDGPTNTGTTSARTIGAGTCGARTDSGRDPCPLAPDPDPGAGPRPARRDPPPDLGRRRGRPRRLDARLGVPGAQAAPAARGAYLRLRSAHRSQPLLVLHGVHQPPAEATRVLVASRSDQRVRRRPTA